jgi:hypothetical protein
MKGGRHNDGEFGVRGDRWIDKTYFRLWGGGGKLGEGKDSKSMLKFVCMQIS